MSKIKLSDYIAKRLKEVYNVEQFFMVSGGGAMHLNDSLGRLIPYIANHHEQACSIAAEGYARLNQKLGVVNVTTGPGGLNCLNGVFGQWTDSVPVLYISGQVKFSTTMASCPDIPLRQLGDQEVDIISVVKPLTKYSAMVCDPTEIKYHLDRAIYEALTGRQGTVWLDIPMNVQGALIEEEELKDFTPPAAAAYDLKVKETIEALKKAERPLIIAGHGIRCSKTEKVFKEIIEALNIPVVTTFNGFDILESEHKNFVGRIGTIGQRCGNFALQNADLILCLGTRNNVRQVSYNHENYAPEACKIVVDIDKAELDKPTVKADLKINADLKEYLPALKKELEQTAKTINRGEWSVFCKKIQHKFSFENTPEYRQTANEINVYNFVHKLTESASKEDTIIAANGSACVCLYQSGIVKEGQRIFWNSGNASMGYDLPAAIGAAAGDSKKNVICLAGDGSIMMNLQELQTIVHNNLPIKIFIINNSGYSSIRQTQRNFFKGRMTGSGIESGVSVPSFYEVGKAFGIEALQVQSPNELESSIKRALSSKGPFICEVVTAKEYTFAPKLSARKLDDGTMVSPTIEDMFPFLDREEYQSCKITK